MGTATSTLNLNNFLNWTGGGLGGTGTTNVAGGGTISGSSAKNVNSANLRFTSAISWSGSGNIVANANGAAITAMSGSLFDVQSNAALANNFIGTYTNNLGATFRKTFTSGTSTINWTFNNAGDIDIQLGTVDFKGGGNLGGTLSVSSSATASYTSGTYTLIGGGSATGSFGNITIAGATMNSANTGTYSFNSVPITLSSGFLGSGGTGASILNLSGVFTTVSWTGGGLGGTGTTNITNGSVVTTSGVTDKNVNTANLIITNSGTFNFGGNGNLVANTNAAAITNNGQFDITGDGSLNNNFVGTFTNNGTFQKNTAAGNSNINWTFINNGTVTINSGTVTFLSGGGNLGGNTSIAGTGGMNFSSSTYTLQNGGQINNTGGGTINFNGAQINLANGASFLINGGGGVTLSSGQIGGQGNGASVLTLTNNFNWTGGGLGGNGSVNNSGTINVSGANPKNVNTPSFVNNNTLNLAGTGNLIANTNGAALQNSGLVNIQSNAGLALNFPGTLTNNNGGTFRKSAGVGTSVVAWSFTNNGAVQGNSGVLQFTGSYSQGANGSLSVSNNAVVNIQSAASLQGSISGIGTIISGGTITHSNGTISPGQSPGQLNVTANLTMSATTTFAVELGGLTQGTQYDFLNVTGSTTLNGATLNLTFVGGFQNAINAGDTFTILTAGSGLTGTFNSLPNGSVFMSNDGFAQFQINYTGNSVVLTSAVPEPTTIAFMAGSALAAGAWYWRRRARLSRELAQDVELPQL